MFEHLQYKKIKIIDREAQSLLFLAVLVLFFHVDTRAQGSWVQISNSVASGDTGAVFPRDWGTALTLNDRIWVLGFDSLQIFDPAMNTWLTPVNGSSYIPEALYLFGNIYPGEPDGDNINDFPGSECAVNGVIYSFGGFRDSDYIFVEDRLHMLDTLTLTWSEPKTFGHFTPRAGLMSAVVNNKIYAIGGDVDTNFSGSPVYNTLEVFDPATNTWSTPLTSGTLIPAKGQCACALNGKIYIFGGAQLGSNSLDLAPNQVFDLANNTWSLISSKGMFGRWYASACALNGKIYLVGGQSIGPDTTGSWFIDTALAGSGNDGTQQYIQIYDPTTDNWFTPYTTGTFDGVFRAQTTVANGKIYVIGGDNGEVTNEVQVFTPGSERVIEPNDFEALSLSPNPTSGFITIRGGAESVLYVSVANVLGIEVAGSGDREPGSGEISLDLSKLPPGTYFVRITTPEGMVMRKVVKE
jgi:N-acetylneuraminic acid mutarotase